MHIRAKKKKKKQKTTICEKIYRNLNYQYLDNSSVVIDVFSVLKNRTFSQMTYYNEIK